LKHSAIYANQICEPEDNVALAWILANPAVTCPIIGPETVEHLEASYKALDLVLNPDVMKKLDEIFPSPGGMAPEAYAGNNDAGNCDLRNISSG